jgi:hypothetical protein
MIFQAPGNESTALKKMISATAWCFSHNTFVLLMFDPHLNQFKCTLIDPTNDKYVTDI